MARRLLLPSACLLGALGVVGTDRLSIGRVAASTEATAGPPLEASMVTGASRVAGYGDLPLSFEPADTRAAERSPFSFVAHGRGYRLDLSGDEAVLTLHRDGANAGPDLPPAGSSPTEPERLAMQLIGGRADAAAYGEAELPGKVHYLTGVAPSAWRTNVPTYGQVRFEAVYPGIDLVYYGKQGELEYDFVVAPGADPTVIQLAFDGVRTMEVDEAGDLVLHTPAGVVRQHKPFVYQDVAGQRRVVDGRYALDAAHVRIEVGAYDASHALVIDPVLVYSGGAGSGTGATGVAVDAAGNAYVGGNTHDLGPPRRRDGFVRKINAAGSGILWTTYIGGSSDDSVYAIALDEAGAAHVTGRTRSLDFPTTLDSFDYTYNGSPSPAGLGDAFVAKLTPDGAGFVYTTYLGGSGDDAGHGIAVRDGHAYVVGEAGNITGAGAEFPTTPGALNAVRPGLHIRPFVTRFDAAGGVVYSTFLGGSGGYIDRGFAIAVDVQGNAYVTGHTGSITFPTVNPAQTRMGVAGKSWAFVTKLNPSGSALVYSTYLGGDGNATSVFGTEGRAIALDATGHAYVTGFTRVSNFPVTAGAFQQTCRSREAGLGQLAVPCSDAFVTKLSPDGGTFVYSTYLGGLGDDYGYGIDVDAAGRAYVTGGTTAPDFPVVNPFQPTKGMSGSGTNAFFTVMNPAGSGLEYSTYLGGSDGETGYAIALDTFRNAYVVGWSVSPNFPRVGGLPATSGGHVSTAGAFIAKFSAVDCAYAVAPSTNISAAAPGSSGSLNLSTTAGCGWATSSTVDWVTLNPISGSGPGPVTYTVAPNSSTNPRIGTFSVANTTMTVQQAGLAPGACTYTLSPSGSIAPPAVGASGSISVTTTATCAWEATSTVPWVTVGAGRTGSGPVTYSVTPNLTASARTGSLFIAGHTVAVMQAAGPATNCPGDADCDGLPTTWETQFGLSATSAAGDNGPDGDPDGDGRTNAQELADGTHPRGFYTRYLAEGATSTFFDTRIALANPNGAPVQALLRFLRANTAPVSEFRSIGARTRATVTPKTLPTLAVAEFATVVESDLPIVVERTMEWDGTGYGSHAETSVDAPATTWYLAEGATHSGFSLFYLIQNPTETAAQVQVTYLRPAPAAPVVVTYTVAPQSRFNIWVNQVAPALASTDVSAAITSLNGVPIIVERAMYLDRGGQFFGAGHNSAGVTAPATQWFLAEGATGSYFDLFILIANPGATAATVTATYLLPSGQTMAKVYQVAANSRFNIWVDHEDAALADTAVSTTLTSTVPVIVERSMWWPFGLAAWQEAHNSPGATATATRWGLAEGEVGGARGYETYILLANTSTTAGDVRVTLLFDDGTTTERTFPVGATSRFNVAVATEFPAAVGRRFGAVVESLGPTPIPLIVERAMYSNAGGVRWAAGTNALGTRLP